MPNTDEGFNCIFSVIIVESGYDYFGYGVPYRIFFGFLLSKLPLKPSA